MTNERKRGALTVPLPASPSRLSRERAAEKWRKAAARASKIQKAIGARAIDVPVTSGDVAAIVGSQFYMDAIADYLGGLAQHGTTHPGQVPLSKIDEQTAAANYSVKRSIEAALYARTERQIHMAVIALTIDFVLSCPGDNVEICDVLWRIYEGYQDVEEGRRFQPFEPTGKSGGSPTPERYARRKAAVSAALSAYMLAGMRESDGLALVMQYVNRVPPSFFGIASAELGQRSAHKNESAGDESVVKNWRATFMKGRSESAVAQAQFATWQSELRGLRQSQPERLALWAERLLHAVVRREE